MAGPLDLMGAATRTPTFRKQPGNRTKLSTTRSELRLRRETVFKPFSVNWLPRHRRSVIVLGVEISCLWTLKFLPQCNSGD